MRDDIQRLRHPSQKGEIICLGVRLVQRLSPCGLCRVGLSPHFPAPGVHGDSKSSESV